MIGEILKKSGYNVTQEEFDLGVKNLSQNTGLIGRMQVISKSPLTIVDAAHNSDGIRILVRAMNENYNENKIYAVFGSSNDKNHAEIFSLLPKSWTYFFTTFPSDRSLTIKKLKDLAEEYNLKSNFFSSPKQALTSAQNNDLKGVTVVCFGSFFLLEDFF